MQNSELKITKIVYLAHESTIQVELSRAASMFQVISTRVAQVKLEDLILSWLT